MLIPSCALSADPARFVPLPPAPVTNKGYNDKGCCCCCFVFFVVFVLSLWL
jgi:hypothetical protein